MGILVEKSVGDILYQYISDLSPLHSATTGTVAISSNGNIFSCDGGYTWSIYNTRNLSAEIWSYNNTDSATLAPTLNSWFIPGIGTTTPFTASTINSGFTVTGLNTNDPRISLTSGVGRFLTISNNTLRASNTRWNQTDWAPAKNSIIPFRYNSAHFGTSTQNDSCNIITPSIFELNSTAGDFMYMAYRVRSRESGTAYINRLHQKLSVNLLESPVVFEENGSSYSLTTNGWVVLNDTTNGWYAGSATTFNGGVTSVYVSNNSGSTNTYTNNVANVSHFYKDITFPKTLQSDVTLSFYWRCSGETTNDYGVISLVTTGITPTVGTALNTTYRIGRPNYSGVLNFTGETITIPRGQCIDQTKRFVFSWVNNSSLGSNPPMVFDNIRIHYYINDNAYNATLGNTEDWSSNSFTFNGWNVVNGTTNIWVVGSAQSTGDTSIYSAYISNDGGTTAAYTNTTATVSHFYKDFVIGSASTLSFYWKCNGENAAGATQYDYGSVTITATTFTPVGGSEVSGALATSGGNGRLGSNNIGKFNLAYVTPFSGANSNWRFETINLSPWSGQTKRIIFSWRNDTSAGSNPPFVLDGIKITGVGDWATSLTQIN